MEIKLSPPKSEFIERMVSSGRCQSADELVDLALGLLQGHEDWIAQNKEVLRQEIRKGIDSLNKGDKAPWDVEEFRQYARDVAAKNKRSA